jgi:hypothetical protein
VHGIIRSNICEDGSCISKATETAGSLLQEENALSCGKATQLTGAHLSYLSHDLHLLQSSAAAAAACWPDVPSSPLTSSSSPRSTETESIGEDDLLAGLVEQVAQTMLEGDEGLNQRSRRSSARSHSEASAPSTSDMEANKGLLNQAGPVGILLPRATHGCQQAMQQAPRALHGFLPKSLLLPLHQWTHSRVMHGTYSMLQLGKL